MVAVVTATEGSPGNWRSAGMPAGLELPKRDRRTSVSRKLPRRCLAFLCSGISLKSWHDAAVSSATLRVTRRHHLFDRWRRYVIFVDNGRMGDISDGETKSFNLEPGQHTLEVTLYESRLAALFNSRLGSYRASFDVVEDQSVAFRCGPPTEPTLGLFLDSLTQDGIQLGRIILDRLPSD
jgi:hypothetical protein